jgi:hypothetical protein
MGHVVKRGTRAVPRYYARFKGADGRYKMRALKGVVSREDALKALARIEGRIADGKPAFERVVVDEERAGEWRVGPLMERWRDSLKNRNVVNDRSRVSRYVLPAYRHRKMVQAQRMAGVIGVKSFATCDGAPGGAS